VQKLCKCPSCLLPGGANQFPGGFTPAVDHHLFTAHPVSALGVHPPLPVGKPPHSNTLFPQFPRCSGSLLFRLCLGLRLGLAAGWNNAL
jgi:hypothetical protein